MQEWKRWRCWNGRRKYLYICKRLPASMRPGNKRSNGTLTNKFNTILFFFFLPFVDLQIPFFPCLGMNNIFLSSLFHVSLNGWRIERVAGSNRVVWLKRVQPYRIRLIAEKTEEEEGAHCYYIIEPVFYLERCFHDDSTDRFFFSPLNVVIDRTKKNKKWGEKKRKKRNDGKR